MSQTTTKSPGNGYDASFFFPLFFLLLKIATFNIAHTTRSPIRAIKDWLGLLHHTTTLWSVLLRLDLPPTPSTLTRSFFSSVQKSKIKTLRLEADQCTTRMGGWLGGWMERVVRALPVTPRADT